MSSVEEGRTEEAVRYRGGWGAPGPAASTSSRCHCGVCPSGSGARSGIADSEQSLCSLDFDAFWKIAPLKMTSFHLPTSSMLSVYLLRSSPALCISFFIFADLIGCCVFSCIALIHCIIEWFPLVLALGFFFFPHMNHLSVFLAVLLGSWQNANVARVFTGKQRKEGTSYREQGRGGNRAGSPQQDCEPLGPRWAWGR